MPNRKIKLHIFFALAIILGLLLVGSFFYHFYEHLDWVSSLYFTTMTVVTVGYGDFVPTQSLSRLFTVVFSLVSIPAVLFSLGIIIEDFIKQRIDIVEKKVNEVYKEEQKIDRLEKEMSKTLRHEKKILEEMRIQSHQDSSK